jgi:rubrerythrin
MNEEPTREEMIAALRANPMRMLNRFTCEACGYLWQQPAATGNCPKCHSHQTRLRTEDSQPCMLQRS